MFEHPDRNVGGHEVRRFRATIRQTGESFACADDQSVLASMTSTGRRGIPVGCLGGGCGVCKVRVLRGDVQRLGPVSRTHVSCDEEQEGYTLACRVAPRSELELEVAGRFCKPFFKGFAPPANPGSGE